MDHDWVAQILKSCFFFYFSGMTTSTSTRYLAVTALSPTTSTVCSTKNLVHRKEKILNVSQVYERSPSSVLKIPLKLSLTSPDRFISVNAILIFKIELLANELPLIIFATVASSQQLRHSLVVLIVLLGQLVALSSYLSFQPNWASALLLMIESLSFTSLRSAKLPSSLS